MTAFASQGSLDRETEEAEDKVELSNIWSEKQFMNCVNWILSNNFKKVCLQFPDNYLPFSTEIVDSLKTKCDKIKVFVLADTSYGSCCVDEIAAGHVDADSLIHFGLACKSETSRLPVYYVFPEYEFDADHFNELTNNLEDTTVFKDIGYHHVPGYHNFPFDEDFKAKCSYERCVFIGSDNDRFFNLSASVKSAQWFIYDPKDKSFHEKNPLMSNYIRRRYFSIEKCKDSKTLGLIVGTLTAKGYLDVIDRIKTMAKALGIRTQIISVGRVNPAKLANFLEIDCFVLIGCPFNYLYNSRDFFKPIVSVFEAEMAFNPAWHMKYPENYVLDFKDVLPGGKQFLAFNIDEVQRSDVSLVGGTIRNNEGNENCVHEVGNSLMEVTNTALIEQKSGLQFEDRSWKGLEQGLGQSEPAVIAMGRSGIPMKYDNEK